MAYTSWSVVFGEQPSASKWNQLGTNDAHFYSFLGDNLVWQDWTPSYTNITVSNGSVTAKYIQIGKTVFFTWQLTCGSTTSISNAMTITLPVTASTTFSTRSDTAIGTVAIRDSGTASYGGVLILAISSTAMNPKFFRADSSTSAELTTTFPITEATGDTFVCTGMYEAA